MRIVVDAMGTDNRPTPDVAGAVMAAREFSDTTIILVGVQAQIEAELAQHDTTGLAIDVINADDVIQMSEKPSVVMKSKPASSIHTGMNLVRDGAADGFVTMGNTGAVQAIATLASLRRIRGVKRAALTTIYPVKGRNIILLDIGANSDSKPEWLAQFALMGSIYARTALGYAKPRVATLSNGEEEGKGNQLVRETQQLLQQIDDIHYVGHLEPKEMLEDIADVIVTDGFVGNIFLKTFEGSISYFTDTLRQEVKKRWPAKIGALLMRGALQQVRKQFDTEAVGGAPLLGVNGVVIVGHGSATPRGIRSAIHQARLAIQGGTVQAIQEGLNAVQVPEL